MGKTSITLAAFKILKAKGIAKKMLIIAPLKPCYLTWPAEIKKWTDFHGLTFTILHGPNKDKALQEDVDLYITNPEGLEWLLQVSKSKTGNRTNVSVDERRFKAFGFDTLCVDELSMFKHPASVRFKALKGVHRLFARRWGLTGSPAPNGLMDLFGQCYILDEGNALGRYITHYRNTYFVPDFNGWDWNLQEDGAERIYKRLKPLALRMSAEDYLSLPPVRPNRIVLDMPAAARKVYDALEHDLYVRLDKKEITAANRGVASIMLRQVASGAIYTDAKLPGFIKLTKQAGRDWTPLHDEKMKALVDLLDELQGAPLLLAYDYNHSLERLQKQFGKDLPYIGNGTTPKRAAFLEKAWNRGELPLMAGHPKSIGHGLNFQGSSAAHVGWFDLFYDYELFKQFIGRIARQGSEAKRIFNHLFIMRDSVDEDIETALGGKKHDENALFDALKARIYKRISAKVTAEGKWKKGLK